MTSPTQGLMVAALGAVLVRICATGEYLHFVQSWMRWPLVLTGLVLLVLAVGPIRGVRSAGHGHPAPWTSWLLLLPTVVVFGVAPPALGAYLAEHRPTQPPSATTPPPDGIAEAVAGAGAGAMPLQVAEFTWGAAQSRDSMGLAESTVVLEGFVSLDAEGSWYVTELVMFCCAADVAVERVKIDGSPPPPRDSWVSVTGRWVPGTGRAATGPAVLDARDVVPLSDPEDPYG